MTQGHRIDELGTRATAVRRDLILAAAGLLLVLTAGLSFIRVFSTGEWRPEAIVAAVISTALAAGLRRLGVGAIVSAASSVAALVVFTYVVHLPSGPLLPGLDEFRAAADLVREGLVQVREVPAPTAPLDGLRILVTSGVWIVALLVHELLVRASRPGAAAMSAAAVWIIPLAVPLPPSATWPTAIPFLAAVGLALALEPDGDDGTRRRESDLPTITSTAAVLGVATLLVAGVAPGLLPGYGNEAWVDLAGSTNPRGYQPIVDVGDRLQLPVDRDVLQVRTTAPEYLRLAALETFDGSTWRLGPAGESSFRPEAEQLFSTDGPLPYEVPLEVVQPVQMDITVLDLENIYVPLPYQVDRVTGPRGSRMFYSLAGGFVATGSLEDNELSGQTRVGVTEGFNYQVEAVVPAPRYEELVDLGDVERPAEDPLVALPAAYGEFAELARQVYDAAGATTTIDRVLAVQDYFIGPESTYRYDTSVPQLRGDGALRDFVFDSQVGYCEYFSTSMAVMLRATGIPARVAVGFLPGRKVDAALEEEADSEFQTYLVSTSDAHAWVEVFFEQYGWVRMDPTPRSDGGTFAPTANDLTPDQSLAEQAAEAAENNPAAPLDDEAIADTPSLDPQRDTPTTTPDDTATTAPGAATGDQSGGGALPIVLLLVVGLAGAGLAASRRQRAPVPHPDPHEEVLHHQRDVLTRAARLGISRRRDETVHEVLVRWHREGRIDRDPADVLARLSVAAAFGGDLADNAGAEAAAAANRIIAGLDSSVESRDRLLAPVRLQIERVSRGVGPLVDRARDLVDR